MEQIVFFGKHLAGLYRARERVNLTIQQTANEWLAARPELEITARHITIDPDGFLTISIMYKTAEPHESAL